MVRRACTDKAASPSVPSCHQPTTIFDSTPSLSNMSYPTPTSPNYASAIAFMRAANERDYAAMETLLADGFSYQVWPSSHRQPGMEKRLTKREYIDRARELMDAVIDELAVSRMSTKSACDVGERSQADGAVPDFWLLRTRSKRLSDRSRAPCQRRRGQGLYRAPSTYSVQQLCEPGVTCGAFADLHVPVISTLCSFPRTTSSSQEPLGRWGTARSSASTPRARSSRTTRGTLVTPILVTPGIVVESPQLTPSTEVASHKIPHTLRLRSRTLLCPSSLRMGG